MHLTYGLVYYVMIIIMILTFCLPILLVTRIRQSILRFINHYQIANNQLFITALYFSFTLVFAIFVESLWVYYWMYYETNFVIHTK